MSEQPPEKILRRIQALLDRARHPNTPGPEAELCAEQAERLMIRHSIEEAVLQDRARQATTVSEDEIVLNGSYLAHRGHLLHLIATVFGCKTVHIKKPEYVAGHWVEGHYDRRGRWVDEHYRQPSYRSTASGVYRIYGFQKDIDMTWTLFEHLLAQLDAQMLTMSGRPAAYKKGFILQFCTTVHKRMKKMYAEEVAASGVGTEMVLATRDALVKKHYEQAHPDATQGRLNMGDRLGRLHGEAAGNRADIFLPGARFDTNQREAINA